MRYRDSRRLTMSRGAAVCALLWLAFTSCHSDELTVGPDAARLASERASAGRVFVCHTPSASPVIIQIASPGLSAHLAHGDYVTTLEVDAQGPASNDGVRFRRITDALNAARAGRLARGEISAAACRVTIVVAPGVYGGSASTTAPSNIEQFPLYVDVPDITLRGAMRMLLDGAGRATGGGVGGIETVLRARELLPVAGMVSTPMIIANAHPGGSAGNGLTVEGFVFDSGNETTTGWGQAILSMRVTALTIRGNRFGAGFTESIDLRASDGDVIENHLGGTMGTCDVCLAGPGRYRAIGNRLLAGGVPGFTTSGMVGLPVPASVEPLQLTATAETWSEIRNNEVRDHLRIPVGTGIRVETVGTGAPNVRNVVRSIIQDNLLVNNRFGVLVHAGFPVAGTQLKGDVDVTLGGNVIQRSCQAPMLVALARHQRALGLNLTLPYLLNSTYNLALNGNLNWNDVWFGHAVGFGNTLIVDGQTIANGTQHSYQAAGCPGL